MKTAEQIALDHGLCHCDEAYIKRGLVAPDCPYHSFSVVGAMQEYAAQFVPQWVKINSESDLPKESSPSHSDLFFVYKATNEYRFMRNGYSRAVVKHLWEEGLITHYAPITKPQPPKED